VKLRRLHKSDVIDDVDDPSEPPHLVDGGRDSWEPAVDTTLGSVKAANITRIKVH